MEIRKLFKGNEFKLIMEEKKESKSGAEHDKKTHSVEHHNEPVAHSIPETHTSNKKSNPWFVVTLILAVAVIVLLYLVFNNGMIGSGKVLSGQDAGKKLVDFLNLRTGGGVTYDSFSDKGDLYEITVSYQGQKIPVYTTKDGSYFVQMAVPMNESNTTSSTTCKTNSDCASGEVCESGQCVQAPKDVPKVAKPIAEAFVFSYCPYGLQFEKAMFPVYDILKNKVDFKIVAIGAMHGEFEHQESLRQICIEKYYGKDKLLSYLKAFDVSSDIGNCNGQESCLTPLIQKIFTSNSIDSKRIDSCMKNESESLYQQQNERASGLGISGSPTFVVNGITLNSVQRTPESIKQAICSGFDNPPSECSKNLSTSASSPGFGSTAGSSSSASCG